MATGSNDLLFEIYTDRISWLLADLNIRVEKVSSVKGNSEAEQIIKFDIRELSKNTFSSLRFTISLRGDNQLDPSERISLQVEYNETQWPAKTVKESFKVNRDSRDDSDALDRCLEEASNEFILPLLTRSDYSAKELEEITRRLFLPRSWTARVWDTGFNDLIEIVHLNTAQVIARYRFFRRKMYASNMDLILGHDHLTLEHSSARYLCYSWFDDSKIDDYARIFSIWRDFIMRHSLTLRDICDSPRELEIWAKTLQETLRTGAPDVSWLKRLTMPAITAYPRIDKDSLGRWLQGYRSGELWDDYGRIGLERFMGEPLDDDLD